MGIDIHALQLLKHNQKTRGTLVKPLRLGDFLYYWGLNWLKNGQERIKAHGAKTC